MDRAEFIKSACITCFSGMAISVLLESCGSTNYFAASAIVNDLLKISKSEFVKIEKEKSIQRKFVLIKSGKYNFPICIFKISDSEYTALLMECTHKSCELNPHGNYLSCPCHGSEFSNKGIVQNPPAESNLKSFIVTTDNENVYVKV